MRMWEIREGYPEEGRSRGEYGFRGHDSEKAYKMGFEEGYERAMRDIKEREYGERSYGQRDGGDSEMGMRRRSW